MGPKEWIRLSGAAAQLLVIVGAEIAFAHSSPNFTLPQAHRLVVRQEQGRGSQVGSCRWIDRHDATCRVSLTAVVIDGQAPESLVWDDIVTRSGACSTHVVRRTGPHSGIAQGVGTTTNCFTGPLVVLQGGGVRLSK